MAKKARFVTIWKAARAQKWQMMAAAQQFDWQIGDVLKNTKKVRSLFILALARTFLVPIPPRASNLASHEARLLIREKNRLPAV